MLKRAQKCHQRRIIAPPPLRCAWIGDLAFCQRLGLHLQIDFRIDVSRVQRNMAEPRANGVDVHPSAEQVRCRRMANRVRADPFCRQRGHFDLDLADVAFDQGVNAETCNGMTAAIEKNARLWRAVRDEIFEFSQGARPQRAMALLTTLATDLHRATGQIEFANEQLCGFLGARSGVGEKQRRSMIAATLGGLTIRSAQERIHLGFVEIGDDDFAGFFEGNGSDQAMCSGLCSPTKRARA